MLGAALLVALATHADAHDPITTKITWSKEIVRILNARCAGCHQAGGVAPMSLSSYEAVRPWAKAIKDETMARRMPQWPAARGFGDFENDRSLSPFEVALIAAWVDGGAPKGDPRDLPPVPRPGPSPGGALVFPRRQTAPAGERRTFTVRTSWTGPRWIHGWQFTANDAAIVQAEFRIAGEYLGNWVPPEGPIELPSGAGVALPSGAPVTVTVTVWYRTARMQEDFPVPLPKKASELRVVFGAAASTRVEQREIACGSNGVGGRFRGATSDPVKTSEVLFAVRPVSDAAAASIAVTLRPPDGPPRPLVWARGVTPAYQPTYRLRDPIALAPGSRIEVDGDAPGCRAWVSYLTSTTKGVVTTRSPR